jgi:post-segregation antitoxin (ccd killing protein)
MADGKTGKTLLEVEIDAELAADRGTEWRRRNAPALEAYDRHSDGDGLWSDGFRTW